MCAPSNGGDGSAVGAGADRDRRGARGDRAVQPAQLGDAVGAAAAGRDDVGGPGDPARDRRGGHAGRASTRIIAGQSRLEVQEGNSIALAFGLAIIVIYLVLAAQFESFRDPFIIMMSVPLSMFGAMTSSISAWRR